MSVQCEQMIATMPELGQLPGILTKSYTFHQGGHAAPQKGG